MKRTSCILFIFASLIILSVSCVTKKELVYVQPKDRKQDQPEAFHMKIAEVNLIQPGDELYIRVTSFDETLNFFNVGRDQFYAREDVTLISYTVNEEGYVKLPYIGKVLLLNKTLEEASDILEERLQGYLNQPEVSIKFVNKKVTVLGEVNNPGIYTFYDKRINIFQALGYANDITKFGNREKVLVIREENNIITKNYVNLLDENIFTSYYYIIKPNDIVYVEPLKKRVWGFTEFPYSLIFSTITTTLLVLNFLR
ncbi:MAG TPA: polysaccharide export protein [Bacteroidetes bacterium]|nr:polysaccharide export protein [Bacteroidota bacterium]